MVPPSPPRHPGSPISWPVLERITFLSRNDWLLRVREAAGPGLGARGAQTTHLRCCPHAGVFCRPKGRRKETLAGSFCNLFCWWSLRAGRQGLLSRPGGREDSPPRPPLRSASPGAPAHGRGGATAEAEERGVALPSAGGESRCAFPEAPPPPEGWTLEPQGSPS